MAAHKSGRRKDEGNCDFNGGGSGKPYASADGDDAEAAHKDSRESYDRDCN